MTTHEEVTTVPTATEMVQKVPRSVLEACETLSKAGFEAWVVGGAVRDLVLGKTPSDWDVASDALPEKVLELFERTIATGLQHGTVTALVGHGRDRTPVEITTFRGEGAYSDSRRPDSVHFGVPLDEDLKRRDFVINAMAFDPIGVRLHDPFGGVCDLSDRLIRAVGVAEQRFGEDGLRVMRAVRFAATLDFALEAETESALKSALGALSKVALERVRVELLKLLGGKAAVRALGIAERNQILATVLPDVDAGSLGAAFERIEKAPPDAVLRLACLLWGLSEDKLDAVLRHLKMSNEERKRVVAMHRHLGVAAKILDGKTETRKFLSLVGRSAAPDALALLELEALRLSDTAMLAAVELASEVLTAGVALEVGDLAISGGAVMKIAGGGGPVIGETLRALLVQVLEDPSRNQGEALEAAAAVLISGR